MGEKLGVGAQPHEGARVDGVGRTYRPRPPGVRPLGDVRESVLTSDNHYAHLSDIGKGQSRNSRNSMSYSKMENLIFSHPLQNVEYKEADGGTSLERSWSSRTWDDDECL